MNPNETIQNLTNLAKPIDKACSFIARAVGPDVVGIFRDRMFVYRTQNALRLQAILDGILKEWNIKHPTQVPKRIGIPFLEAAFLEDDETLLQCWGRLLANAMNPDFKNDMHRQFGEILRVISPIDCLVLDACLEYVAATQKNLFKPEAIADNLGKAPCDVKASFQRLRSLGLFDSEAEIPLGAAPGAQAFYRDFNLHHITEWGRMFLRAISLNPVF